MLGHDAAVYTIDEGASDGRNVSAQECGNDVPVIVVAGTHIGWLENLCGTCGNRRGKEEGKISWKEKMGSF